MSINIEPEIKQKLEALSALTGRSQTELANEMLRKSLNQITDGLQEGQSGEPLMEERGQPERSLADRIREWVIENQFKPVRQKGIRNVTVVAGFVHKGMGLRNRLPAVCAALGSDLLVQRARVKRTFVDGPSNGARTAFTFDLGTTE